MSDTGRKDGRMEEKEEEDKNEGRHLGRQKLYLKKVVCCLHSLYVH